MNTSQAINNRDDESEFVLVDAPLESDAAAYREMATDDSDLIAEEDLRGCRFLLVRRVIEAVKMPHGNGGIVQFACTFQPGTDTSLRFESARVSLQLESPEHIQIASLQPEVINDDEPVEFTRETNGKIGLKNIPHIPVLEGEIGKKYGVKYTQYHCLVTGSGEATKTARWILKENPVQKAGIGSHQVLAVTLPVVGEVKASLAVTARVVRSGLIGTIEAVRDLILPSHAHGSMDRKYPISFTIPEVPPAESAFEYPY